MIRFILGTLALLGTAIFAFVIEGGNPASFFLPTPLILVVCVPLFAVLAVWSLKDWGKAWKDAFAHGPAPVASSSSKIWDFYEKSCYIAGIVGFILGLNIIFQNGGGVDLKDALSILKPLSIDCIAPILAILFAMVARILRARVERDKA
jgi:hypothetical protein